jgi:NAD(P)-dependent dehydrogenase (short-subunit alcohol dehydrogenase family)
LNDPFGLAGKRALVVGGGQGIGESAALRLADAGCDVAVLDLEAERAESVAEAVRRTGRSGIALVGNVVEDGEAARLVDEAADALGGLDIVVSIVGAARFGSVLEMTPQEWDGDHARNLRYFFFLCQAAARSFIRRGVPGTIVGIATAGAIGSMPFRPAYGAAKAGLVHLVRTLAVELGEHGIRINAVAPGMTVTPRTAKRMGAATTQAEAAKIPLGRLGTPDDVGKVILFFASDLAGHVTGTTLVVDGGALAAPNYDLGPSRAASARNRRALGIDLAPQDRNDG